MKVFRSSGGNSAYSQMFINDDDDAAQVDSAASKFGEEVSDGISKKVVFLTLVLLGIVPLFMPLDILGKADGIKIIEVCSSLLARCPFVGTSRDTVADPNGLLLCAAEHEQ